MFSLCPLTHTHVNRIHCFCVLFSLRSSNTRPTRPHAAQVEDGVYILDFNPCVLTAAQAFAAALSTFETKYLL